MCVYGIVLYQMTNKRKYFKRISTFWDLLKRPAILHFAINFKEEVCKLKLRTVSLKRNKTSQDKFQSCAWYFLISPKWYPSCVLSANLVLTSPSNIPKWVFLPVEHRSYNRDFKISFTIFIPLLCKIYHEHLSRF